MSLQMSQWRGREGTRIVHHTNLSSSSDQSNGSRSFCLWKPSSNKGISGRHETGVWCSHEKTSDYCIPREMKWLKNEEYRDGRDQYKAMKDRENGTNQKLEGAIRGSIPFPMMTRMRERQTINFPFNRSANIPVRSIRREPAFWAASTYPSWLVIIQTMTIQSRNYL